MTAILWFRRDLRLNDNAALTAAAACGPVLPVFLIDPVLEAQGAASRWRLGRAVQALDADLRRRFGSGLTIRRGSPDAVLATLAAEVGADTVHATAWPEAARTASDRDAGAVLKAGGRALHLHDGHTLLPPGSVRTGAGGPFRVYTAFARAARRAGIPQPIATPHDLRLLPALPGLDAADFDLAPDMRRGAAVLAAHTPPFGEDAALARLRRFLDDATGTYAEMRDRPDMADATSSLSDALAVGEIGPRMAWAAASAVAEHDPAAARGGEKFMSELLWRDFAWSLLAEAPDLPRTHWRREWSDFPWRSDGPDADAWRRAMTGEPMVDAGLREMFVTGRMHNRVRMIVASYLTKHLLTDWRIGLAWFADTLIDWDPASNAMNWQWVAGSGPDASPFFRIFNPALQAERYDPDGAYRRRWLWGWQGSREDTAGAYFDAVPREWGLSRDTPYPDRMIALNEGRARALAALETMKG